MELEKIMEKLETRKRNTEAARENIRETISKINDIVWKVRGEIPHLKTVTREQDSEMYSNIFLVLAVTEKNGFDIYENFYDGFYESYTLKDIDDIYFERDFFKKFTNAVKQFLEKLENIDTFEDLPKIIVE